jgi:hypothetical protein
MLTSISLISICKIFVKCCNNNFIDNLKIHGSGEQGLKDANGDKAHLFEVHMEELKK